eukprot:TRINITY_DN2248_c0_g1_i4.p1 TRINITY_DN2248_c0_g1~~TRINITY_DN2248_c0_g1_i4.p1  ORF type:complete len:511 (-),score=129.07 TRINITY_DN2248_c0_g1_i4:39-1571(-)
MSSKTNSINKAKGNKEVELKDKKEIQPQIEEKKVIKIQKKIKEEKDEEEEHKEIENEGSESKKEDELGSGSEKAMMFSSLPFSSFGIDQQVLYACENLGFRKPTRIQAESLPYSLHGRDIIGLAQTGSGKTAAFAIPIINALIQNPHPLFALVIAPTRELAIQISEQFEAIGSEVQVRTCVLVGGVDKMDQALNLAKKPHIVIGTPGRILYHLERTKKFLLSAIKFLVLDEADRLLDMDFEDEINTILKVLPKERQTFLFSATMTSKVAKLERASLQNPVKVEVSEKYSTVDTLTQNYLFIPFKYKECYLVYLLNELSGNSIIVFTQTCSTSEKIEGMLHKLGFPSIALNGSMPQEKRNKSLEGFKLGYKNVLIATDVASRGLDIPNVDVVINYDVPTSSKSYVHRVGRTARAGAPGKAITFVTQYDVELYQRIEQLLDEKLEAYPVEESTVLILEDRVSEALRLSVKKIKEREKEALEKSKNNKNKKVRRMDRDTENDEGLHFKKSRQK